MKKLFYLPFILLLVFNFTGCNTEDSSNDEAGKNIQSTAKVDDKKYFETIRITFYDQPDGKGRELGWVESVRGEYKVTKVIGNSVEYAGYNFYYEFGSKNVKSIRVNDNNERWSIGYYKPQHRIDLGLKIDPKKPLWSSKFELHYIPENAYFANILPDKRGRVYNIDGEKFGVKSYFLIVNTKCNISGGGCDLRYHRKEKTLL